MRRGKSSTKALPKRNSALRLAISLFVMLAFGLQSYITQTHIHLKPDTFSSYAKLNHETGKQDPADKFPANGDPANCPICQEILHSGQFVTPTAAVLLLPTATVSIIKIVADIPVAAQRPSHAWRSRAPPKA
ncbi:MAG TPA: hypothetical protein VMF58_10025 [Rhizomicrobium sp.]|nr:hypothetical protein [Rhizomicrobium sp.]